MTLKKWWAAAPALFLAAVVLNGCGGGSKPAEKGKWTEAPGGKVAQKDDAPLPEGMFLNEKPEGAKTISELKPEAKEGDAVVLRARIAGRKEPFVDGMAVLTIADVELPSCNEIPGDKCPYPWDLCCEPAEKVTRHSATLKILDEEGRALAANLEGKHKLLPLSVLVVKGTVGPRPSDEVLVIHANGIFVEKEGMKR